MNTDNQSSCRVITARRSVAAAFAGALLSGVLLFPAIANADDFTDPTDRDGDGVPTLVEVREGTNPDRADSDGDGLNDLEEKQFATLGNNPDTDGDGVLDGDEIKNGKQPLDPNDQGKASKSASGDTDGDGLSDNDEITKFFTNIFLEDTDFDGVSDPDELNNGTNPLIFLSH